MRFSFQKLPECQCINVYSMLNVYNCTSFAVCIGQWDSAVSSKGWLLKAILTVMCGRANPVVESHSKNALKSYLVFYVSFLRLTITK